MAVPEIFIWGSYSPEGLGSPLVAFQGQSPAAVGWKLCPQKLKQFADIVYTF